MYRIMKVVSKKSGYASLYQYLTTTIDGNVYPLEIETKAKLDKMVENMLNNEGYSKSDFIIIEVIDYDIDATNYSDGDDGDDSDPDDDPDPDDETSIKAYTETDVLDAFNDDVIKTVILGNDISCDSENGLSLSNGKEKTLKLNGHSVTGICNEGSEVYASAFYVSDGTLTIEGNGSILGGRGCHTDIAVCACGETSEVIIKGGSYNTDSNYQGDYNDVIYASEGGTIEIYDGYFNNVSHDEYTGSEKHVLNIQDDSGSTIICYGGEYVDQNPADGDDNDTVTGSTFLADGYSVSSRSEDGHTIYTVTK